MAYYFYATYADPEAENYTSTERITVDLSLYPYCVPVQDNLLQAWKRKAYLYNYYKRMRRIIWKITM